MKNVNKLLAEVGINLNFNLPETTVQEFMCKVSPNLALQLLKKRNAILQTLPNHTMGLESGMREVLNNLQNTTVFFERNFDHNILMTPVGFGETYFDKCVRTLTSLTQTPPPISGRFMAWLLLGDKTNNTIPDNIYANFERACATIGLVDEFRSTFSPESTQPSTNLKLLTALNLVHEANTPPGHFGTSSAMEVIKFGAKVTSLLSAPMTFGTRALDLNDPTPLYDMALARLGKLTGIKCMVNLTSLADLLLLGVVPKEPIFLEPESYQNLVSSIGVQFSDIESYTLIQNYVKQKDVKSNNSMVCMQTLNSSFAEVIKGKVTPKEESVMLRVYTDLLTRIPEYVIDHHTPEEFEMLTSYIKPLLRSYHGTFSGVLSALTAWHDIRLKLNEKADMEMKEKTDTPLAKLMTKSRLQAEELIAEITPFLFEDRKLTSEEINEVLSQAEHETYLLALLALENQIDLEGVFDNPDEITSLTVNKTPASQTFPPEPEVTDTPLQIKLENPSDEVKVVKYVLDRLNDKLKYQGGDLDNVLQQYFSTRPVSIDTVIRCLVLLPKSVDTSGLSEEIKTTYETLVAGNGTMQIESFPTLGQSIAEGLYLALLPVVPAW